MDVLLRDKQDMSEPQSIGQGADNDSGSGYINVQAAINIAREYTPSAPNENVSPDNGIPMDNDPQDPSVMNGVVTVGSNSAPSILILLVWFYLRKLRKPQSIQ